MWVGHEGPTVHWGRKTEGTGTPSLGSTVGPFFESLSLDVTPTPTGLRNKEFRWTRGG